MPPNHRLRIVRNGCQHAPSLTAFLIATALAGCQTFGSGAASDQLPLRLANADYPVPVPVALHAFGYNGGPMALEPSSVRNLAFAVWHSYGGGMNRTRLGMEAAPLLVGGQVTLDEYLSSRLLRLLVRPRISIGVDLGPGYEPGTSLGLRWMLHDDADLRADSTLAIALASARPDRRSAVLDSLRPLLKEALWNRSVYELAVAGDWTTRHSKDGRLLFAIGSYHGFLAAGFPMLGESGQLQTAASFMLTPHPTVPDLFEGSVTARAFYGSATERLFLGLRLDTDRRTSPDFRIEVGGQLRLANGLWMRPDIGWSLLHRPPFGPVASLTLCFGTPEASR